MGCFDWDHNCKMFVHAVSAYLHFFELECITSALCVFIVCRIFLLLQVAECLVPKIRSIAASGSTKPTYLRFLTGVKAYSQIFSVCEKPESVTLG